jgi:hypothetical protein
MAKFRKKPVVIEAVLNSADLKPADLHALTGSFNDRLRIEGRCIFIETLEGVMKADEGDWIIKGVKGEFYPCKPDIFEATYERVED